MRIAALAPSRPRVLGALALMLVVLAGALVLLAGGAPSEPLVLHLDGGPSSVVVSGGRVWVAAPRSGQVAVFDATSGAPAITPLRIGGAPARLALGSGGLWVADAATGAVVPVQTRPLRVRSPIPVGADASDIVLAGGALWVASSADSRVYRLDGGGATALPIGRAPVALATDDRRVVVADTAGALFSIDTRTRRAGPPVRIGGAPVDVALAGDTTWVADARGRVHAVRDGRVADSIDVGRRVVAVAAAGEDAYVLADDELVRVRDGAVRARRPVGAGATALAVDGKHVWVAAGDRVLRFER